MNDAARLLFGKKELEIIQKQQQNVKLTQSERNRLSGIITKKINAIHSWQNISLQKGSFITAEITTAIRQILATKYGKHIKRIYLFGSQCDGTAKINSDIDLAVDIDVKKPLKATIEMGYRLSTRIDLSILDCLPFKNEVRTNGKIIYAKSANKRTSPNISLRYRRFSQVK